MGEIFFEGMILQAGLIFALGPQHLFVLESGIQKGHHQIVSLICFLCDFSLIMLGVIGAATFFIQLPQMKIVVGILEVGFLATSGMGKIRQNSNENYVFNPNGIRTTFKAAILNSITFSVINPHAYLDGIVLIGGYSSKYSHLLQRMGIGPGAAIFSLIWFLALSNGASIMRSFFSDQKRMRIIQGGAGLVLIFLSIKLSIDVYSWIEELYPEHMALLSARWRK